MSEPITVAAFTKLSEAEEAVRKLIDGGVPADELSKAQHDSGEVGALEIIDQNNVKPILSLS